MEVAKIELSLGFSVFVYEDGQFYLPSNRTYTTAELKKIAAEINRTLRAKSLSESMKEVGMLNGEE